jgi:hypothetical protein
MEITTLVWAQIEDYLVIAQTKMTPSRKEWSDLLDCMRRMNYRGALVHTEGGSPNALQRKQLRDTVGNSEIYTAILTDSPIVRAAMTALNLFVKSPMRGFTPNDIEEALSYMQVPSRLRPDFQTTLATLKQQLKSL